MNKELETLGMTLTASSLYIPQSNDLPEGISMILTEKGQAMLELRGLKATYWSEAVRPAADLYNRTILSELGSKTAMRALLGNIPDNSKLSVFECAALVHAHKERRQDRFCGRADRDIYLSNERELHREYSFNS